VSGFTVDEVASSGEGVSVFSDAPPTMMFR
jgi:hypothetical protein